MEIIKNNSNIKQKRRLLLAYATEIHVCVACLLRDATPGKRRCAKCTERNRIAAKKQRNKPGNCTRCGQALYKEGRTEKHCCWKKK